MHSFHSWPKNLLVHSGIRRGGGSPHSFPESARESEGGGGGGGSPHSFPESARSHFPKTTPLMTHLMGRAHIARQSVMTAQLI